MARSGLHLAVLWSFAVAKPLFDILADDPAFFVARELTGLDVAIFSTGLVVLPPLLLLALEALADRLRPGLGRPTHLFLVGLIAAALAIQLLKEVSERPAGLIVLLALAAGAGFAAAYRRTEFVPTVLTVLSPAPVLFLVLFLVGSPVSKLVFPGDGGEPAERVASDAPVVILLFDELPLASLLDARGRIDASRYPSFARLARQSTWYRNATAVAAHTSRALPAILSGDSELDAGPPVASAYPESLFTLLGESHRMHVVETATRLCPERLCAEPERDPFSERMASLIGDLGVVEARRLLPGALAEDLPAVNLGYVDLLGRTGIFDDLTEYRSWLEKINSEPGTLHLFHLELPHARWRFLPGGGNYPLAISNEHFERDEEGTLTSEPAPIGHLWQRHLLQLGYADRLLGRLLDHLHQIGIWRRSLVVAMADHGAAFEPGQPRRAPTDENLEGIAPIPVFVKEPGQERGELSNSPLCSNGVLHVIATILGATPAPDRGECSQEEVRVLDAAAQPGVVERDALRADLRALVRRQRRLFGARNGWAGVWAFGDDQDLIGRRVSELPRIAPGPPVRLLDAPADPGPAKVPALLAASASGGVESGDRVAVAIGGRISAVAITYELDGEVGIAAMIRPAALARGPLRLYRVTSASGPRLQALPIEP